MKIKEFFYNLFNDAMIERYNKIITEESQALQEWVYWGFQRRDIIPSDKLYLFNKYDKDIIIFRQLSEDAHGDKLASLPYHQKQYIVDNIKDIAVLYKVYQYYLKLDTEFSNLCYKYPLVMRYYVDKYYQIMLYNDDKILAKGKYQIKISYDDIKYTNDCSHFINSFTQLSIDAKKFLVTLEDNYPKEEIRIRQKIQTVLKKKEIIFIQNRFKEQILDNERRKKFYTEFTKEQNENPEEFCINHIEELDRFVYNKLRECYYRIKDYNPKGYNIFKERMTEKHLYYENEDLWEYCISCSDVIHKYQSLFDKYDYLFKRYPSGIKYYRILHGITQKDFSYKNISLLEILIKEGENRISELQKTWEQQRENPNWIDEQEAFTRVCKRIGSRKCLNWMRYTYKLDNEVFTKIETIIPQRYSIYNLYKYTYNGKISNIESNYLSSQIPWQECINDIFSFVYELKLKLNTLLVVFADNITEENFFYFNFVRGFIDLLEENEIYYGTDLINIQFPSFYKYVLIIDLTTTTKRFRDLCSNVISTFEDIQPHIGYITIFRQSTKSDNTKELRESNIYESREVMCKPHTNSIIRKEEYEEDLTTELKKCVLDWNHPAFCTLPCFSMYYYYPTTCDWEASEEEWEVRNLIWNFKANPNHPMPVDKTMKLHYFATQKVIREMSKCLRYSFRNKVSRLTLVCVPSSKEIINERRYKDFSDKICSELGMENAYSHVTVIEDGEAKHSGGTKQAAYSFDKKYFYGKYVLLFDDVITSGRSMDNVKRRLELYGAHVIAGFSIGRTKHTRMSSNPIDDLLY